MACFRLSGLGVGFCLTGCWWTWAGTARPRCWSWPDGGLPEEVSRAPLAWPLDADALEDLRWYLEDYLLAPFGVWEDRGPAVQDKLAGWGDQVFGSVFGAGPGAVMRISGRGTGAWRWCSGPPSRACWGCRGS